MPTEKGSQMGQKWDMTDFSKSDPGPLRVLLRPIWAFRPPVCSTNPQRGAISVQKKGEKLAQKCVFLVVPWD